MNGYENELISVIVPVYNVERFLDECVESILKQTYRNLQIILIDDGSTDSSGKICDYYAKKDDRVLVIHQKNMGVSAARNVGLKEAKGKFLAFADSDDYLPPDAYENMLKNWTSNTELLMGRIQKTTENGGLMGKADFFSVTAIEKNEFIEDLLAEKKFAYLGYLVDKLFLGDVIQDNKITFDSLIKVNEDRLFILQYLLCIKYVSIMEDIVYFYRQRSSGVINKTRNNVSITDDEMTVLNSFYEMRKICKRYSEKLYYVCGRKGFESGLDLLKRVASEDMVKKKQLKFFLRSNCIICLKSPYCGFIEKFKILGHAILKK